MINTSLGQAWHEHVEHLGMRSLISSACPSEELKFLLDAATLIPDDPLYPNYEIIFTMLMRENQSSVLANILRKISIATNPEADHPKITYVRDERMYYLPNGSQINAAGFIAFVGSLLIEGVAVFHFFDNDGRRNLDWNSSHFYRQALQYSLLVAQYRAGQGNGTVDFESFGSFERIAHAGRGYLIYDPQFMIVPYKIGDKAGMPHIERHPLQDARVIFGTPEPS